MESVRKVDYYKITIPNKTGQGAKVVGALSDAGVNLLAFTGFPAGQKSQIDFIPEDSTAFEQAAKRTKIKISQKKPCFVIQGDDRTGAIANILEKLAQAKVNVIALDGVSAGAGRYGAILWVKPKDMNKAATTLSAY
ncbi:MAG: hypothetical protein A2145_01455 [candidate division Zixibacteria bacterium RBG_16_40_9]|nr:MAG: hypothetical protein A2145_01455 [candidate division Zixibacteria bacterium RBG_16_40_9]